MSSISLTLSLRGRLLSGYQTTLQGALFGNNEPGFTFEPWDITTLYQDRAGTTPVTAAGQSVGLRLDKSKGLRIGPELVTNGDFSSSTGWSLNGVSIAGGKLVASSAANGADARQAGKLTAGVFYQVNYTVDSISGGSVRFFNASQAGLSRSSPGTYTEIFTGTNTALGLQFVTTGVSATIDNISVRELAGNHEVAINDAARGVYGREPKTGKRNLLTYTEDLSNAVWVKTTATITANAETAPDGTLTANRVEATGIAPNVGQDIVVNSTSVTLSAYFKKGTNATAANALLIRNQTLGTNLVAARVNLDTGAITYLAGSSGAASESVGNGWWKLTLTASITSGNTVRSGILGGYAATVGHFSFIWGAQLEVGSTATAYQRVASQYDITEAGVPSCYYVQTDGVDDAYVTPTITPNTDKVQVFAGVRKLSDAATALVAETSTTSLTNNGSISLFAPDNPTPSLNAYSFASRGTTRVFAIDSGPPEAPTTNVLTGLGDISGDLATLRVNGVQVAQNTTDQGTGNYLAYPAYIYARGGTSLPFNGRDYGHAVRFGPNLDAATIARVEALIARNTPTVTL